MAMNYQAVQVDPSTKGSTWATQPDQPERTAQVWGQMEQQAKLCATLHDALSMLEERLARVCLPLGANPSEVPVAEELCALAGEIRHNNNLLSSAHERIAVLLQRLEV